MAYEWQPAWQRWRELVPPPDEPVDNDDLDWEFAQSQLNVRLPDDYRAYIDTYGVGYVNRLFLVLHPTTELAAGNLADVAEGQGEVEGLSTLLRPPPYAWPGIGPDRLMACATTTNGDVAYWYTDGPDPGEWPIVLRNSAGDRWETFEMSLVELLLGIFTGTVAEHFARAGWARQPIRFAAHPFTG